MENHAKAGVSDYTNTDTYCRLRRHGTGSSASFHLCSHGATVEGTHDTGVTPSINTWYCFIVEVEAVGTGTAVRVKIWQDNTAEPTTWQIDTIDSTAPLTSGTFGLWAYSSGSKYWDDLAVESLTGNPANTPTPTNTPDATATNTPDATSTPTATPDPGQTETAVIQRSTYSIAGQAIALRVVEKDADGTVTSNTLYYTHSDHLGSTSAISDNTGTLVDGSTSRFAPFGSYRTEPTADLNGRGFTGHKENRDIGLTYMNARYYVVGLNRFASADTIVPNPMNPQGFNRYSYTYNNPILFLDPSGHFTEEAIWNYISGNMCEGSDSCTESYINAWKSDGDWWEMLSRAEAGDTIYGTDIYSTGSNSYDLYFSFKFVGLGNSRLDGLSGFLPGASELFDQTVNLFTGGRLTHNHELEWYGVYRGQGGAASPVLLRSGKTRIYETDRQTYVPGSNTPQDGSAAASAFQSVASEGVESFICDSVPIPGCSFAWAALSGSADYEMNSYVPEPDYIVGNGPVTFYYKFNGDAILTDSGAEGDGGILTVYHQFNSLP
jgi:RHS repeat-associated protein